MHAKADLHVHSRHSNRPSEWILRRLGTPECFVDPREVYRRARENGMDFVTITDHNTINGALAIADLPSTFLSSELTTYFPETGCKIHVLVHGITETQFHEANQARANIYELQAFLRGHDVLHTVAHPLFAVNDKLTLDAFEKLILMFERFEVLNGMRHGRSNRLLEAFLKGLTPAVVDELSNKHGIDPVGRQPYRRTLTGGSDDHSGEYIACAYTVTPAARTVEDFLAHLRAGAHMHGGNTGTSLRLAHSFYHIGYSYYRTRLLKNSSNGSKLIEALLGKMANAAPGRTSGFRAVVGGFVGGVARRWKATRLSPAERALVIEFSSLFQSADAAECDRHRGTGRDAFTFDLACRLTHRVGYHFLEHFAAQLRNASLLESLQIVSSLGPLALSITPYLAAFRTQHKDETLLREFAGRFRVSDPLGPHKPRKVWFTDTFNEVNGIAKTIWVLSTIAQQRDWNLTVATSVEPAPADTPFQTINFQPVGMFELPEYNWQRLAFPPFLNVVEYLEREHVAEIIISTPGPLGLAALAAARILGLKVTAIYHTDFPKFVEILTEDELLKQLTVRFMVWFYGQADRILAPSNDYREHLVGHGLDRAKIRILPGGVDTARFNPAKRDPEFWTKYNCNGDFKFLYVGRISKEKDLDLLAQAFTKYRAAGYRAELILVGDGPFLKELQQRHSKQPDIVFTGMLHDEDLARAYASADAFVFPSTADTFGNVVLEAQASGLPAIVSDIGGPREIVCANDSGLVFEGGCEDAMIQAMARLQNDVTLRMRLRERGLRNAAENPWGKTLESLWSHAEP